MKHPDEIELAINLIIDYTYTLNPQAKAELLLRLNNQWCTKCGRTITAVCDKPYGKWPHL